jgi:WD40 repeat protein
MLFETAWSSLIPRTELAILEGHTDRVRDVCSIETAGGPLLASVGRDATVRIWDPATGQQLRVLRGHAGEVFAVLFLAGVLVSAADDRTVRIWDPATGELLRVLTGFRGASPVEVDGRTLVASATGEGTALWDPATGQVRQVFRGADTAMSAVRADGRMLVAARSGKAGVGVWDSATGEPRWSHQPDAHTTSGVCAVTAGGRELMVSAGYDRELDGGRIRLWAPATGELERTIEFEPLVERTLDRVSRVHPLDLDGRQVLVAVGQKTVRILDPVTGTLLQSFVTPSSWVESTRSLSLGGRPVIAVSELYQGTIWLWDPTTGELVNGLHGEKSPVEALCPFECGGRTVLATADGVGRTVRLWDPLSTEKAARHRGHNDEVCGVWPVGDRLISIAQSSARIWDPATGEKVHTIRGSLFGIADLADITVDGRTLLAGAFSSYDMGSIRIWDPATGRQVRRLERRWEEGPTVLCPFTVGDRALLAAGDESDVRVWDPSTGRLEQETPCESLTSWLGRVTIDGRPVMVGRDDEHGLRIWDPAVASWQPAAAPDTGRDAGFAFMVQDRPLVAGAEKDGTVWIHDLLTGETRCVLRGHTGYWITGIGVATVGDRTLLLTSGGDDRTVRLWDPDTGQCTLTIPVHHEVVGSAQVGDGLLAVAVPSGVLVYRVRER